MASLNDIPAFLPSNFLSVVAEVQRLDLGDSLREGPLMKGPLWKQISSAKYLLPDLADLTSVVPYLDIHVGWSSEGLLFAFKFDDPFQSAHFPRYERGNAIEIFIDTRDNKSAKVPGRFCHQFVFLPKEVDGTQVRELSRFRGEDKHELCQDSDLRIESECGKKLSTLVFIPTRALFGFDPAAFPKIGLSIIAYAPQCDPQHFGPSPREYTVASHPSLWPSIQLV